VEDFVVSGEGEVERKGEGFPLEYELLNALLASNSRKGPYSK